MNEVTYLGPFFIIGRGPVGPGPGLAGLFACGRRKRTARSGLTNEKERAHYVLVCSE